MDALKAEGLFKRFGGLQAIVDVSFRVGPGERIGIIGPNGAGKTTLFNLVTGLIRPDAGKIHILDNDVTMKPIHERVKFGLGRTFQVLTLLPHLTVLNNVLLAIQALRPSRFGMFRPLNGYRDLVDEAEPLMAPWGLWESRDTLVHDLSYGQQRCLELILSLASKPKVLLLDEPTCGMTPSEVAFITNTIENLGKDISIVLITHDLDLIFGLHLDSVIVLHYGNIVAHGSQEDIKNNSKVREIYLGRGKAGNASGG